MKLGRLPRRHDPRVPHMRALLGGTPLPAPPSSIDWTIGMPASLGVYANDSLGDCTCAAVYHAIQVWTFNAAGTMDSEPDSEAIALYSDACGYVAGQPNTDQGGDEQSVLTYLLNSGAPVTGGVQKIAAFVEVDVKDIENIKSTIADFALAYIGFDVPNFLMNNLTAPNSVWDVDQSADNGIAGGHAVIVAGYDEIGLRVISWGNHYTMTWAFWNQFVDEAYAIADVEWIKATGNAPCGLSLAVLEAQMQELKSAGA